MGVHPFRLGQRLFRPRATGVRRFAGARMPHDQVGHRDRAAARSGKFRLSDHRDPYHVRLGGQIRGTGRIRQWGTTFYGTSPSSPDGKGAKALAGGNLRSGQVPRKANWKKTQAKNAAAIRPNVHGCLERTRRPDRTPKARPSFRRMVSGSRQQLHARSCGNLDGTCFQGCGSRRKKRPRQPETRASFSSAPPSSFPISNSRN